MTFVFSGNGMSEKVAEYLDIDSSFEDTLGFVFPVYGWRTPKIMARFIRDELKAKLGGFKPKFVWLVVTCGDDCGYVDCVFERQLFKSVGLRLDAAYSVKMPDTYLGLPGFRLDTEEEYNHKLASAKALAVKIATKLRARIRRREINRGIMPRFKSYWLGWFFEKVLENGRFWKVDAKKCMLCGQCVKECPTSAIAIRDNRVVWVNRAICTLCFRCYHNCHHDAIECGPFTKGKGRLFSSTQNRIFVV